MNRGILMLDDDILMPCYDIGEREGHIKALPAEGPQQCPCLLVHQPRVAA
jgi:hypothetical protein